MRIALVTGGLPFGGTTTFCMFLAAGFNRIGVPVKIFSFRADHPLERDFRELNIPVQTENDHRHILEDRMASVLAGLREFQPTAVFAVLGSESFEILRYLPKGVLRVGMIHDHFQMVYDMVQPYAGVVDHMVVVSRAIADHVQDTYPQFPCTYLQHGVFLADKAKLRVAAPSGPLKLLFFGRYEHNHKQVLIFPEIYRELKRLGVAFKWTIHGRGPDEAELRQKFAEAERNGDVVFSTPVPHDQLPEIIRRHDVYMLASVHEAGPLTLLEAMGHGLVPVCGDIPCLVQEVVKDGANGFRVPVSSPVDYANAVARLDRDRGLLEKLSAAARDTVEKGFSETAMALRYVDFLKSHSGPETPEPWPKHFQIKPMLGANPLLHGPGPARWLRRTIKALRRH